MEPTAVAPSGAENLYDVIVAGGGISGIMAAAKIAVANPHAKILLIDKEPVLGGRLRQGTVELPRPGYGLSAISDSLLNAWQEVLESHGISLDEAALPGQRQHTVAVLAGNRLAHQNIDLWFTAKGARILGGLAAAKHWPEVEEIVRQGAVAATVDDDDDESVESAAEDDSPTPSTPSKAPKSYALSHYWKQTRKAPAAVVLEHFGMAFGIPDVWDSAPEALAQRAGFHSGRLHTGDWSRSIRQLIEQPSFQSAVAVTLANRIVDADWREGTWRINCAQGSFCSKSLVVAQPPWQATSWLKRTLWPPALLQVASKTKPVSAVVLSERIVSSEALDTIPDVTIVPAEKVQIVRDGTDAIYFQATIDFELSLQAPAVVKAVKALKRARKKLQQLYPGAISETSFVALLPVAWAQSPGHTDKRWLTKLNTKNFNTAHLAFCGDAYGSNYDGDSNILRSLALTCEALQFPG
ncbi:MAG: FAD-dependent oxidoreductase [Deltaproteobacteria bacterium]|nr:FAD-dependent oxidoreductase [Deltaproteobacteria bacterium]